jgi:hypothetical protein
MNRTGRQLGASVFFLVFTGLWAAGQLQSRITGTVVDSESGTPVEYAQIQNFSLQKQTYSTQAGEFSLNAFDGDTLVVYGLGYFYAKVIVSETMLGEQPVQIVLTRQPYNLSAAKVVGIGTYNEFRNKLINEPPPKTMTEQLNERLAGATLLAAREGFQEYQQAHPVIVSVPIRTPEEIERIKLAKIKAKEQVRDQVYHKFNPVIVKEITGLTDDREIIEFMVYCKFSDAYIIEANSYELAERITTKFELFRKKKEEEKLRHDPMNFIDTIFRPNA